MSQNHSKEHDIIEFDILKIYEDNKLKLIKEIIEQQKSNLFINKFNTIHIEKNNSQYIQVCEKSLSLIKQDSFNKLIELIIDDYENYPNYSHFHNIENIYNMLFKKNFQKGELESYNCEEIEINIIYINNIQGETKLFSKAFVNKNEGNAFLKINDRKFDLKTKFHFDSKETIVSIKLVIKQNLSYIDLSKMFSNCYNLKSLNGISKLQRIKIVDKMFYNCISLENVPDISEWDISKVESASLMFNNCISLKPFPNFGN